MAFRNIAVSLACLASVCHAWMPNDGSRNLVDRRGASLFSSNADLNTRDLPSKIRGVSLGSLFVFEKWIDSQEWSAIGCDGQESEFDCVLNTGQERSDEAFQGHWKNWITEDDLDQMVDYSLNTIRVPLGYWLYEDLVDDSEHFPKVCACG